MIVKRNLHPIKIWHYIKKPILFVLLWSIAIWLCFYITQSKILVINFTPIGVLGSALAIFVAFRNNSAYGRWWEARKLWGGIVNSSRVLSRLIITFADSHSHQENYNKQRNEAFKNELIYNCIAWVHTLRLHLRHQENWQEVKHFLNDEEFKEFLKFSNKPNYVHLIIGKKIYKAMANGTLGGFDSFQMEGQLLALTNYQGGCERIKNTPLPRQYDFFTRLFVYLFALMLPFGLLSFFQNMESLSWLIIPLSLLIALVFVIMERTGAANENPFENKVTDVPLTAICNTIEIDLKQMLGDEELPIKVEAEKGYLF